MASIVFKSKTFISLDDEYFNYMINLMQSEYISLDLQKTPC